ncbi:MAG: DegT/DnrJ/EryC1/StrS family aminotransferase [Bdellovibrionales bacterium]|nr:DegT/DnrJ/EryC1/StrS family aminotransferase [Bdellovibrionales bacterium]
MGVPLLDLQAQLSPIRNDILEALTEVLDSTRYIMGPKVTTLEEEVAQYCGARFGIGVSSGTDALLVALMAYDVKPGDIVLTSTYSFFATAGVVSRLGAEPAFVDIDPVTYNIDPQALSDWFESNRDKASRVKAIVPVHLYGQCADMNPILELASRHGIPVIEDAAQAIGAQYPITQGDIRSAGSMGEVGCFSFFPSKNLGCLGDGGMVVTSDQALADKISLLRNHGAKPKYYHAMVGGNFRLDPIQAAVLSVKLPYLDGWAAARRKNAEFYDAALKSLPLELPTPAWGREHHVYNQYVISVPERRDEFREFLNKKGIGNEVYYPVPFHLQQCFENLGYREGDFPKSEKAATHTVAIPIFAELTEKQMSEVVGAFQEYYG